MHRRNIYSAVAPPSSLTGSGPVRPNFSAVAPPGQANRFQQLPPQQPSHPSHSTVGSTVGFGFSASTVRKRAAFDAEDEYFDQEDTEVVPPSPVEEDNDNDEPKQEQAQDDDDEEDPLDAFMKDIEQDVKKLESSEKAKASSSAPLKGPSVSGASTATSSLSSKKINIKEVKGVRSDIDAEDAQESYYKYMEDNPNSARNLYPDDDDGQAGGAEVEYDADGNPISVKKTRYIDPLPPIDHSVIKYEPFDKDFYDEHPDIAKLSDADVITLRKTLEIRVSGAPPIPRPVCSFGHLAKAFDEPLMDLIRKHEFTQPTPIQAQAIPIALSGRDLIGVAVTGSGKTAAYLWPMLVHIMAQRELARGEGPIALVLVPTRELAIQVYGEVKKFGTKAYNLRGVCAYGGGSRWEQTQDLAAGVEIVVATPGRMIDHIKSKATNLTRVTYLVLDEADRMFDMGFEPQVRSICDHVRPDRQCLMFSATFKKKVERLARDSLSDPVKVIHSKAASGAGGDQVTGEANEDVTQIVNVYPEVSDKWTWLNARLVEFQSTGSVLIFVTRKDNCEELATNLRSNGVTLEVMHGDMDQGERNRVMQAFKKKQVPILVATDVAARGLDVPHIRTVINYDVARDIDTHTHRVGRTGRAGEKGIAYTLVTPKDKEFAGHLVRNLEAANQDVPEKLLNLAMESSWFNNTRFKRGGHGGGRGGRGRDRKMGGAGLGYAAIPPPEQLKAIEDVKPPTRPTSQASSAFRPPQQASRPQPSGGEQGGGGGRISALRAQMAAKFQSQFRPSSDAPPPQPAKPPESKRSRWDT